MTIRLLLAAALTIFAPARALDASLIGYSNRSTWQSATGPYEIDNFNSIQQDMEFRTQTVAFGGFSVRSSDGLLGEAGNLIDAIPFVFNQSVDGTTHLFGDVFGAVTIDFAFKAPIPAWGADFLGSEALLIEVFSPGGQLLGTIEARNGVNQSGPIVEFAGFRLTDGAASRVLISKGFPSGATNDSFAMHNVGFAAVPEPASFDLWLILLVVGCSSFGRLRANHHSRWR